MNNSKEIQIQKDLEPTTPVRSRPTRARRVKAASSLDGMFDEGGVGGGGGTPTTPGARSRTIRECLPPRLQQQDSSGSPLLLQTSKSADAAAAAGESLEPKIIIKDNSLETDMGDLSLHDLVRTMRQNKRQVIDTVRTETGGSATRSVTRINFQDIMERSEDEFQQESENFEQLSPPLT